MKPTSSRTLLYALGLAICLWSPCVAPNPVNHTIDDQYGDSSTGFVPIYWPNTTSWANQNCAGCDIQLDVTKVYDRTYSAATYDPATSTGSMGISIQFTGTAIYVYFTLANFQGPTASQSITTSANFTVDAEKPVLFIHERDLSTDSFQYQVLVFSQTNLQNNLHVLNITTTGSETVYVNFDYAIYTRDDDTVLASSSTITSKSQKSSTSNVVQQTTTGQTATVTRARTPVGAIVGGITGGIVISVVVIFLLLCWRRCRGRDAQRTTPPITEFDMGENPSMDGLAYTQPPVHSKASRLIPHQTAYNSAPSQGGVPQNKLRSVSVGQQNHQLSHQNTRELTRDEVRQERQEELHNRLRMVQQEMVQVTALGEQRTLGVTPVEGADLSASDVRMEIQLMREQIELLREQQRSTWALGLSDNPPPGYTPMDTRIRGSREITEGRASS